MGHRARSSFVVAIVVWHVASLTTLPSMACCCIAALTHDDMASAAHEACEDDTMPPGGAASDAAGGEQGPVLRSCAMGDDALLGFLHVTAEVPATAAGLSPSRDVGRTPVVVERTTALALSPPAPTPRS